MFYNFKLLLATKRSKQTGQTQSDQGLPSGKFPVCYSDMYFVNYSPDNQQLVKNRKRKVLEILEHLPYVIVIIA